MARAQKPAWPSVRGVQKEPLSHRFTCHCPHRAPSTMPTKRNTPMDMQYQLKAGSYYLYDMREAPSAVTGERRFKLKTDTVAIAFDAHTGEVHQHGSPTASCSALRSRFARQPETG